MGVVMFPLKKSLPVLVAFTNVAPNSGYAFSKV